MGVQDSGPTHPWVQEGGGGEGAETYSETLVLLILLFLRGDSQKSCLCRLCNADSSKGCSKQSQPFQCLASAAFRFSLHTVPLFICSIHD